AKLLLVPGAVGLVALDSFALGIPLVTTNWPWHGPEFEYLTPGANAVVTGDHIDDYAREIQHYLSNEEELGMMKAACLAEAPRFSVEKMAQNFANGVCLALADVAKS